MRRSTGGRPPGRLRYQRGLDHARLPFRQTAGVANQIELKLGAATDTLAAIVDADRADSFDLAFIDADKTGYAEYCRLALHLVEPGGLILLDNMLQRGRVVHPAMTNRIRLHSEC